MQAVDDRKTPLDGLEKNGLDFRRQVPAVRRDAHDGEVRLRWQLGERLGERGEDRDPPRTAVQNLACVAPGCGRIDDADDPIAVRAAHQAVRRLTGDLRVGAAAENQSRAVHGGALSVDRAFGRRGPPPRLPAPGLESRLMTETAQFSDYKTVLYPQEDGSGWVAEIPAISGCYALMPTRGEALVEIERVFRMISEEYSEQGKPLPTDRTELLTRA